VFLSDQKSSVASLARKKRSLRRQA
jgi:hypothetical protein